MTTQATEVSDGRHPTWQQPTVYVGSVEQVVTSGGSTTTTTYYYANGQRIALAVNGVVSYLAADGLGSAMVALNASGSATASLLYAPYGGTRYISGTMPTDYGFTGQRADAATGLDYYNARYYDAVAGQFTSADSVLPGGGYNILGLSRYAYVEGNPETLADPSGDLACRVSCKPGWSGEEAPAAAAQPAVWTIPIAAAPEPLSPWDRARAAAADRLAHPSPADLIINPVYAAQNAAVMWVESLFPDDQRQAIAFAFGVDAPLVIGTALRPGVDLAAGEQTAASVAAENLPQIPGGLLEPGRYADAGIPALGAGRDWNAEELAYLRAPGKCHTCGSTDAGTVSGRFVGDHEPPSSLTPADYPQVIYRQCAGCISLQGGWVAWVVHLLSD